MYELHLSNVERNSIIRNKSRIKFPYGLIMKITENFCLDKKKYKEINDILNKNMKDPTNLISLEEIDILKGILKDILIEVRKQDFDCDDLRKVINFLNLAKSYKKEIMILANKLN